MQVGDKVSCELGEGTIVRLDEYAGTKYQNRWVVHIPVPTKELSKELYPTNEYCFFESELTRTSSQMYIKGYENAAMQFAYIPDFSTPEEKKDFERGLKDGYAKRKRI